MNKSPGPEHLLIDGYNLIRSTPLFSQQERISLEAGRQALQQVLAAYARQTHARITLYFDGGQGVKRPATQNHGPLEIVFSRSPRTADDLIKERAREKHGAKRLRIITSDREIRNFARRHKIRSTPSDEFVDELDDQPSPKPAPPTPEPPNPEIVRQAPLDEREIAEWERLFNAKREDEGK